MTEAMRSSPLSVKRHPVVNIHSTGQRGNKQMKGVKKRSKSSNFFCLKCLFCETAILKGSLQFPYSPIWEKTPDNQTVYPLHPSPHTGTHGGQCVKTKPR